MTALGNRLLTYGQLIRFSHFAKNLFIFLPLFFTGSLFLPGAFLETVTAFVAFCLLANAVYIFNDIHDVTLDRAHPTKKNRPLAKGVVSTREAWGLFLLLFISAVCILRVFPAQTLIYALTYFVLMLAYTLWLKHIAIIDVLVIAVGFVLRIFVGASLLYLPVSHWIVAIAFLLALFLGFSKRVDDVVLFHRSGVKARTSLDGYTLPFLNIALSIVASMMLVSYLIYSVTPEIMDRPYGHNIYLTSIFVFLGVLRYLQRLFVYENTDAPADVFYKDRIIQFSLVAWGLLLLGMIYL